jgi:HPt (histidine-containing phosphotransfer) domain-containing protein
MNDEERFQQQLASIGTRYLARTLGEMTRLRELLESVLSGGPGTMREVEHLAHKIHGSGAMFGFDVISDRAGEVEQVAGFLAKGDGPDELKALSQQALQARLRAGVAQLCEATLAAAKERGVELNVT